MNERKIVVTGIVGVVLLVVVALLGIAFIGGGAPAPGPQGGAVAPAAEPQPALPPLSPAPVLVPAVTPAAAEQPAAPSRTLAPAAVPRPAGATGAAPWESVETAMKPSGLGLELAAPVSDGLADMRDRLQPCFDEETRRLATAKPVRLPPGVHGPAVLVLRLEAEAGKLVVVDSEVASQGTSSRQLVECCRRMLRSHELSAPVEPPQRYKVLMPLQ